LVGGTNGKGSTVAMLSKIYENAGYRVGSYTSPHIYDFRERIRIDDCDVLLFEVGLGGRLDATNLWDADCAVITSIALDHEDYLGSDLSVIATEKAAIGRQGRMLVVGDVKPPSSLFDFTTKNLIPVNHVGAMPTSSMPTCNLSGEHQRRNAACASAVITYLQPQLPVGDEVVLESFNDVSIPARFERVDYPSISVLYDVAHNPAGAKALADAWREEFGLQKAQVLFACLADKDISGLISELNPIASQWHCLPLTVARARPADALAQVIQEYDSAQAVAYPTITGSCLSAISHARENNQPILVAGSFHRLKKTMMAISGNGFGGPLFLSPFWSSYFHCFWMVQVLKVNLNA